MKIIGVIGMLFSLLVLFESMDTASLRFKAIYKLAKCVHDAEIDPAFDGTKNPMIEVPYEAAKGTLRDFGRRNGTAHSLRSQLQITAAVLLFVSAPIVFWRRKGKAAQKADEPASEDQTSD